MQKKFFVVLLCLFIGFLPIASYSQSSSYKYLMELGKRSLSQTFYEEAVHYFNIALQIEPDLEEPLFFIDFAKRLKEGRIKKALPISLEKLGKFDKSGKKAYISEDKVKSSETLISDTLDLFESRSEKDLQENDKFIRRLKIYEALGVIESKGVDTKDRFIKKWLPVKVEVIKDEGEANYKKSKESQISEVKAAVHKINISKGRVVSGKGAKGLESKGIFKKIKKLTLIEDLWNKQPVSIVMKIRTSLILKGKNIKKFLIITPDILFGEKKGDDELVLTANVIKRSTFLHVWDDRGRWTFNINVIFPESKSSKSKGEKLKEEVKPFKFNYFADYYTLYSGEDISGLEKTNLSFTQRVSIEGLTPYGMFDSSVGFTKYPDTIVATSYTTGLANASIGPFKNFNLRGFDLYKKFSNLTLPGSGMRGAYLEGKILNGNLGYDLVWGRERVILGQLSSGAIEKKESFLQGARITLFPYKKNKYHLNIAKGYGTAREDYLADKVYSIEAEQYFGNTKISSEFAYDEDNVAATLYSSWKNENSRVSVRLRNIEKNFTTLTGRAGGQGQIGVEVNIDNKFSNNIRLSSDLDVYRDRVFYNPRKRNNPNFELRETLVIPLTNSSSWQTSFYYDYTPGAISPQRSLRLNNQYSKSGKLWNNRRFSWFLANNFQRQRRSLTPTSNSDRYGLIGGMNLSLLNNLSYYINYNYSMISNIYSGEDSYPRVLSTGLSYSKLWIPSVSSTFRLSYQGQEGTQTEDSFLSGVDSLIFSFGVNYRPSPDIDFFINGNIRNAWTENSDRESLDSSNIRFGFRTSFDFRLFAWNPKGEIRGVVFEDMNANGVQDRYEKGIPNVKVKVGKKEIVTDKEGKYKIKVRAKKIVVAIDIENAPEKYIVSTSPSKKVEIFHKGTYNVDFGLTTQAGIYGIIFYDKNGNGKPDSKDVFIPHVKVILDGVESSVSDSQGSYFFRNVLIGRHTIKLDMVSLPLEYIPLIKVSNEIELFEGTTSIFHIPLKKKP